MISTMLRILGSVIVFGFAPIFSTQSQIAVENLMKAELKIGADCQPSSWVTKLDLKTMNQQQTKSFWLGQRYAVERDWNRKLTAYRISQLDKIAEDRIANIEDERMRQSLALLGKNLPPPNPRLEQALSASEQKLAAIQLDILRRQQEWAIRCYQHADNLSK
jgi:hypothetical protein